MRADRQTDRQTRRSQCFAHLPEAGRSNKTPESNKDCRLLNIKYRYEKPLVHEVSDFAHACGVLPAKRVGSHTADGCCRQARSCGCVKSTGRTRTTTALSGCCRTSWRSAAVTRFVASRQAGNRGCYWTDRVALSQSACGTIGWIWSWGSFVAERASSNWTCVWRYRQVRMSSCYLRASTSLVVTTRRTLVRRWTPLRCCRDSIRAGCYPVIETYRRTRRPPCCFVDVTSATSTHTQRRPQNINEFTQFQN